MGASPILRFTEEQYLAMDQEIAGRSEFHGGVVLPVEAATVSHEAIVANLLGEVRTAARGTPGRVFGPQLRTRIPRARYCYPDATLICGSPELYEDRRDTIVNPVAVFEILSPSTESFDRGLKFAAYRDLPSLRQYVLIAQTEPRIEWFVKSPEGFWVLHDASGPGARLEIPSIAAAIPVASIYEGVEFEPAPFPGGV